MADFAWNEITVRAAHLVAEGQLTNEAIVAELGCGRTTFYGWIKHDGFAARVDEILDDYRKAMRRRGIAVLERRVESLNRRHELLWGVIDARAADPELAKVPGGKTGLVVRDLKGIGKGEDFQVVETHSVDGGTLRALLDIEKQVAQELGQWTERRSIELPVKEYAVENSPDDL